MTWRVKFDVVLNEQAGETGSFIVEVNPEWAPHGANRFRELIDANYLGGGQCRFYRTVAGFMSQFGIHGDPAVYAQWASKKIPDDPVKTSNAPGFITFATSGPNCRTTQLFINLADNARLDGMGFSPFGRVVEGMDVVNRIYSGYGECAPSGQGPAQAALKAQGNAALASFPKLSYIKATTVL